MAIYPPQQRSVDPYDEGRFSTVLNRFTRIITGGHDVVVNGDLSFLFTIGPEDYNLTIGPGVVIKDDVLIHILDDFVLFFNDPQYFVDPENVGLSATATEKMFYVVITYEYNRSLPAPKANYKIIHDIPNYYTNHEDDYVLLGRVYSSNHEITRFDYEGRPDPELDYNKWDYNPNGTWIDTPFSEATAPQIALLEPLVYPTVIAEMILPGGGDPYMEVTPDYTAGPYENDESVAGTVEATMMMTFTEPIQEIRKDWLEVYAVDETTDLSTKVIIKDIRELTNSNKQTFLIDFLFLQPGEYDFSVRLVSELQQITDLNGNALGVFQLTPLEESGQHVTFKPITDAQITFDEATPLPATLPADLDDTRFIGPEKLAYYTQDHRRQAFKFNIVLDGYPKQHRIYSGLDDLPWNYTNPTHYMDATSDICSFSTYVKLYTNTVGLYDAVFQFKDIVGNMYQKLITFMYNTTPQAILSINGDGLEGMNNPVTIQFTKDVRVLSTLPANFFQRINGEDIVESISYTFHPTDPTKLIIDFTDDFESPTLPFIFNYSFGEYGSYIKDKYFNTLSEDNFTGVVIITPETRVFI